LPALGKLSHYDALSPQAPTSTNYTLQVVLAQDSWASRFVSSTTHRFAVVNEYVQFDAIPRTLLKIGGSHGVLRFSLSWLTLNPTVNMIITLRNLDNPSRGYVRGATVAGTGAELTNLPAVGNAIEMDVVVGSWAETGSAYLIEVHMTTGSWGQRFASTGQQDLSVLNEVLHVDPVPTTLLQLAGQPAMLSVTATYTSGTVVSVVVLVRHESDNRKYARRVTQTNGNGLTNLAPSGRLDLRVQLGGWASARSGYTVEVLLTRGTWDSRFLRSTRQTFAIEIATEAASGHLAVGATQEASNDDALDANTSPISTLLVVAAAAVALLVGTATVAMVRRRFSAKREAIGVHRLSIVSALPLHETQL
jgi:hypothetical protein